VNILNVLPPLVLLAIFGDDIIEALLAEILNQDIFSLNVGPLVVHGAIATVG
jgi:hypothetical protein